MAGSLRLSSARERLLVSAVVGPQLRNRGAMPWTGLPMNCHSEFLERAEGGRWSVGSPAGSDCVVHPERHTISQGDRVDPISRDVVLTLDILHHLRIAAIHQADLRANRTSALIMKLSVSWRVIPGLRDLSVEIRKRPIPIHRANKQQLDAFGDRIGQCRPVVPGKGRNVSPNDFNRSAHDGIQFCRIENTIPGEWSNGNGPNGSRTGLDLMPDGGRSPLSHSAADLAQATSAASA